MSLVVAIAMAIDERNAQARWGLRRLAADTDVKSPPNRGEP